MTIKMNIGLTKVSLPEVRSPEGKSWMSISSFMYEGYLLGPLLGAHSSLGLQMHLNPVYIIEIKTNLMNKKFIHIYQ